MEDEQEREALNAHWQASTAGDANAEHDIYDDEAICDYPQSGERILGRNNLQALRSHHPGKAGGLQRQAHPRNRQPLGHRVHNHLPGRPSYTVSIMEFRNGKVVHESTRRSISLIL
jgi:hypothetical protein